MLARASREQPRSPGQLPRAVEAAAGLGCEALSQVVADRRDVEAGAARIAGEDLLPRDAVDLSENRPQALVAVGDVTERRGQGLPVKLSGQPTGDRNVVRPRRLRAD